MRLIAAILAASVGCGTTSYQIPASELVRLAAMPPEQRGAHVRVIQQLHEADVGPPQPVTGETQISFGPRLDIYAGGGSVGDRPGPRISDHRTGGGGGGHHSGGHIGGGGDGKGEAIVILVAAAVVLVVVAAVEGSRFDGYAQLHPMQPIYLVDHDGNVEMRPLAWLDPQAAALADHAIVRSSEGPWRELERAPLSRQGFTYALFGGIGTYASADGSKGTGTATTIQLGYFLDQKLGIVGSVFLGWRDNAVGATIFESRYTAELQAYPVQAGPVHLGVYAGGGAAYRWEDGLPGGNAGSLALLGGALLQLDINTRLAITGRLGITEAHGEQMSDALIGLSVY